MIEMSRNSHSCVILYSSIMGSVPVAQWWSIALVAQKLVGLISREQNV